METMSSRSNRLTYNLYSAKRKADKDEVYARIVSAIILVEGIVAGFVIVGLVYLWTSWGR